MIPVIVGCAPNPTVLECFLGDVWQDIQKIMGGVGGIAAPIAQIVGAGLQAGAADCGPLPQPWADAAEKSAYAGCMEQRKAAGVLISAGDAFQRAMPAQIGYGAPIQPPPRTMFDTPAPKKRDYTIPIVIGGSVVLLGLFYAILK